MKSMTPPRSWRGIVAGRFRSCRVPERPAVNPNAVSNFLTFSRACVSGNFGRKCAQVSKRQTAGLEPPPWKLLLWTALAGLIFGLIGFGEIAEDLLRVARNSLHQHKASGDIVLVKIDDQSLRQFGHWPWPRRTMRSLSTGSRPPAPSASSSTSTFAIDRRPRRSRHSRTSLERSRTVTLADANRVGTGTASNPIADRCRILAGTRRAWARSLTTIIRTRSGDFRMRASDRGRVPSFASASSRGVVRGDPQRDLSRRLFHRSVVDIPSFPRRDVLDGTLDPGELAGKDVVDRHRHRRHRRPVLRPGLRPRLGGVYVHVIGAETLKHGAPVDLGWFSAFLLALGAWRFALPRNASVRLGR